MSKFIIHYTSTNYNNHTNTQYPISWRNDYVGSDKHDVTYDDNGYIQGIRPRQQADNAAFCNMWAKNLKDQQGLGKSAKKAA